MSKIKLPPKDRLNDDVIHRLNYNGPIVSTYNFSYETRVNNRIVTKYVRKDGYEVSYFVGYYSKTFPELDRSSGVRNFSDKSSIYSVENKPGFWLMSHETDTCIPFELYSEANNIYDEYKVVKNFFKENSSLLSQMRVYLYILQKYGT